MAVETVSETGERTVPDTVSLTVCTFPQPKPARTGLTFTPVLINLISDELVRS